MRVSALLLLAVLVTTQAVEHRPPKDYRADTAEIPLPGDLITTLDVPTKPILIGSSWVLHYVIHNRSISELTWMHGGDYRGARPTRVWLEALAPDGVWAVDPLGHTSVNDMGGIGGGITIPAFGTSVITVVPQAYLRLDRPGRWTLRMFHDLGMGPPQGEQDPRWATATIDLVMPDEIQARQVIATHERLIDKVLTTRETHDWPTAGERGWALPDFQVMAVPVFLTPLKERVRQGSRLAIAGIAEIPTAEACDALLEILQTPAPPSLPKEEDYTPNPHPWSLALLALAQRFPPPAGQRGWAGTGDPRLLATIDAARREHIHRIVLPLAKHEDTSVQHAAGIVLARCVPDAQALLPLIAATLDGPRDESAFHDLLAAYRGSGAPVPDPTSSPAAAMVWLDHQLYHPKERPQGWQEILAPLLVHPAARIREWSVMLLTSDNPARWTPAVIRALQDDDAHVRSRAINTADNFRDPALVPFLQAVMLRQRDPNGAATKIGRIAGRSAEALAWIAYVEHATDGSLDPFSASNGLAFVFRTIARLEVRTSRPPEQQPTAEERRVIAARLRDFVTSRREAIDRGALGMPDDTWPKDLLPDDWWIMLPDDQSWPPGHR